MRAAAAGRAACLNLFTTCFAFSEGVSGSMHRVSSCWVQYLLLGASMLLMLAGGMVHAGTFRLCLPMRLHATQGEDEESHTTHGSAMAGHAASAHAAAIAGALVHTGQRVVRAVNIADAVVDPADVVDFDGMCRRLMPAADIQAAECCMPPLHGCPRRLSMHRCRW